VIYGLLCFWNVESFNFVEFFLNWWNFHVFAASSQVIPTRSLLFISLTTFYLCWAGWSWLSNFIFTNLFVLMLIFECLISILCFPVVCPWYLKMIDLYYPLYTVWSSWGWGFAWLFVSSLQRQSKSQSIYREVASCIPHRLKSAAYSNANYSYLYYIVVEIIDRWISFFKTSQHPINLSKVLETSFCEKAEDRLTLFYSCNSKVFYRFCDDSFSLFSLYL
jgi:hypothetical protein